MPGRGNGEGRGRGNAHGRGGGHGTGLPADGPMDRDESRPIDGDMPGDRNDGAGGGHGRSELSPGHRKQAAGAQSARDFAPGRAGRAGSPALLDIAPDEVPAADD